MGNLGKATAALRKAIKQVNHRTPWCASAVRKAEFDEEAERKKLLPIDQRPNFAAPKKLKTVKELSGDSIYTPARQGAPLDFPPHPEGRYAIPSEDVHVLQDNGFFDRGPGLKGAVRIYGKTYLVHGAPCPLSCYCGHRLEEMGD